MEDISAKLAQILSDDETMQQIMGMVSALGGPGGSPGQQSGEGERQTADSVLGGLDLGALLGALGMGGGASPEGEGAGGAPESGDFREGPSQGAGGFSFDPAMFAMLGQMMGAFQERDKNVDLLLALKPYFQEPRQSKVDDAIRIMKLLHLLPLLRESGILGDLFGGKGNG